MNIACSRTDFQGVCQQDIKTALETCILDETVKMLPDGLDTPVGLGGRSLSGGQKQRVCLARARLRDTPILIMDEATSALDRHLKVEVMSNIRTWRHGKTTIIITHDLSQIRPADYVYTLENGRVVWEGFYYGLKGDLDDASSSTCSPSVIAGEARLAEVQRHAQGHHTRKPSMKGTMRSTWRQDRPTEKRCSQPSIFQAHSAVEPDRSRNFKTVTLEQSASSRRRSLMMASRVSVAVKPIIRRPELELTINLATRGASKIDAQPEDMPLGRSDLQAITSRHSRFSSRKSISFESTERPETSDKLDPRDVVPLMRIFKTIWPTLPVSKRVLLFLGFLAAALHATAGPTFSWVFSELLSTFYGPSESRRAEGAKKWSLSVLAVAMVDGTASYCMHVFLEFCGQCWIDNLRHRALRNILDQPMAFFFRSRNSPSALGENLDRNAEEMRNLLGRFAGLIFVAVLMTAIGTTWALMISWRLTLVALAAAPIIYLLTRTFDHVSAKWEMKSNEGGTLAHAVFTETFVNLQTVFALTLEDYFHHRYLRAVRQVFHTGLQRAILSGALYGLVDAAILLNTVLIFFYGTRLIATGVQSTETILAVYTLLIFTVGNVNAIVGFLPQINSSRSTATKLLRLVYLPFSTSHEHKGSEKVEQVNNVQLDDLYFSYPLGAETSVLNSLSLSLSKGSSLALVGQSGSGKSTVATLLLKLHPLSSGSIRINGVPLSSFLTTSLRKLIGFVPQHPILFPGTIAANISYPIPPTTQEATELVHAAAKGAAIHDFITTLPNGYEQVIGAGGSGLSGGQMQRIAIARALFRQPQMLVVDEVTSGLDGVTAMMVRGTIRNLAKSGIMVLAITHDEAMMEACDEVAVMKEGRIAEQGRFRTLIADGDSELSRLLRTA